MDEKTSRPANVGRGGSGRSGRPSRSSRAGASGRSGARSASGRSRSRSSASDAAAGTPAAPAAGSPAGSAAAGRSAASAPAAAAAAGQNIPAESAAAKEQAERDRTGKTRGGYTRRDMATSGDYNGVTYGPGKDVEIPESYAAHLDSIGTNPDASVETGRDTKFGGGEEDDQHAQGKAIKSAREDAPKNVAKHQRGDAFEAIASPKK